MTDDNVVYQPVESSNLLSVGYDPQSSNLFVIFKDKETGMPKSKYCYYHVPPEVFSQLLAAPSKGKYHAAHIKKVYAYDQVNL